MTNDLNSVNISLPDRPYHHGALRQALIEAAEAVIGERGVDGFSLRETARRAGVSPAAPGHHFKDARGLLTAVATATSWAFGDALEAADSQQGDRIARLHAQGMAYVRFALANRAKFDLMWRHALVDAADADFVAAGRRAFSILDRAVRGDQPPIDGPQDPSAAPSIAAWSLVHGFAKLAMEGVFGTEVGAAERAADTLLPRVLECLEV
jgi:AcrR family transcriptional regulator